MWLSRLVKSFLRCSCFLGVCPVHGGPQVRATLKVEQMSNGPFVGQKSVSCLTIYPDGRVTYFHRWNPGKVGVDAKTGKKVLLEQAFSVESRLSRADLLELPVFLESEAVQGLRDSFAVPHVFIDYHESTTVEINGSDAKQKRIVTYDYGTADLERKSQLPAALVVLMDKIEEIKNQAALKGKTANIPLDCQEIRK